MYDELIKELRIYANDETDEIRVKAADAIEQLIEERDAYRKAMTHEHNRAARLLWDKEHCWIPVTERLPECDLGAEVGNIEWISNGMVHAGCFGRGGKYRDAYFRTWTDAGEGMDAMKIIAICVAHLQKRQRRASNGRSTVAFSFRRYRPTRRSA